MASVSTKIANMALSHLGVGKQISDITTDQSQEGKACREFYEICRDLVLKGFDWPFATQFVTLGLVEEDPTTEWAFSYRYPSSCIRLRRILSLRNDNRQSRTPYRIGRDDDGKLVYTDQEDAEVEFTFHVTNAEEYPDDFVMAVSLLLANYMAPRLTAGDPFKMGERAIRLYAFQIKNAEVSAVNEEQDEEEPESEFIRTRS